VARLDELRLLTRISRLYYVQGLSQATIASQLDLSQARVSRLLQRAEREGIVRITISTPRGVYADLEEELQEIYGLKQAIVVDCTDDDEDQIVRDIGAAAAYYVETTLKQNEVIGISSWSAALLAMVDAMQPLPKGLNAQVVQILGGVGNPAAEVHAARLTQRLASLVAGSATFLPAPGIVGSCEAREILMGDPYVCESVALFGRVTLALVGIGALEPSKLLLSSGNTFSIEELAMLQRAGAVGDICLHFFDSDGKPVITPLDERVISMPLEQLKRVKRSVGVAGGQRKQLAIRGALLGGFINVLITDQFTAQALIRRTSLR